jgi:hypothetical protein
MDKFDIVHNGKKGSTIKLYFSQKYNPIIFLERLQTCALKSLKKKKLVSYTKSLTHVN